MPNENPQDGDRVARHCYSAKHFRDDERTILTGDAFKPRDNDEFLSVNWLEYHTGSDRDRINAVCRDIFSMRKLKPKDRLGILRVGVTMAIGAELGEDLDVTHEPVGSNKSHSGIWGVRPDRRTLHEELAAEASNDVRHVVVPSG